MTSADIVHVLGPVGGNGDPEPVILPGEPGKGAGVDAHQDVIRILTTDHREVEQMHPGGDMPKTMCVTHRTHGGAASVRAARRPAHRLSPLGAGTSRPPHRADEVYRRP